MKQALLIVKTEVATRPKRCEFQHNDDYKAEEQNEENRDVDEVDWPFFK